MAIKSRPVYPGLSPDTNARRNVVVCDKGGAAAVVELLARADADFAKRTEVILSAEEEEGVKTIIGQLQSVPVQVEAGILPAIDKLRAILASAKMGVRLYAAGTEPLIGSVVQAGADYFIDPLSIRTEHRGSLKRRVQCVHCKGMTEDVTTNPVKCAQCGLLLLVRDHYSKRLAAFQGVCINAEDPTESPELKVEFQ